MKKTAPVRILIWTYLILQFVVAGPAFAKGGLLLFAPASMADVAADLADGFTSESGIETRISIAGTAQLARQIDNGAPADVFLSADQDWIDWLKSRGRIDVDSVTNFAGNSLVVAIRRDDKPPKGPAELVTRQRFSMAEPETIPAGRYAKQALISLSIWDQARKQAVFGENVRISLRQLALGEVDAAIVYATDVAIEPRVKVGWRIPAYNHTPIAYFAALIENGDRAKGRRFVAYLNSVAGRRTLADAGFAPPASAE